jgi:hypothetical protein
MQIEEAIEIMNNFIKDTPKMPYDLKMIDEVKGEAVKLYKEIREKDKVIDEMAKYINNEESGNIYELTCTRECENEKCRMSKGDNELQEIKCIKEYFYKKAQK